VKLTVDIDLTSEIFEALPADQQAIAFLLSRSLHTISDMPLEAFTSDFYGLEATPDYPIAAIAANVDGLSVQTHYWLRAEPVYLVMQRDTFSMGDQVPLPLVSQEALALLETLNNHFNEDGLLFEIGISGAWYLKVPIDYHALPVETILPAIVIQKNITPFMPKGAAAHYWIALQNEIQMLLFQHPVNDERELRGELPVNSLWFSGGGQMPVTDIGLAPQNKIMVASSPIYEGIANYTNMNFAKLDMVGAVSTFGKLIRSANQDVHLKINVQNNISDWFESFVSLLKSKAVSELTLNIGWYENTITAVIKPFDLRKFWRQSKPLNQFLK
jgi:hypothetical protein